MKQNQLVLILYLICLYNEKNNLNLNTNQELTKKSILENVLYSNFTKTMPRIVISSLVNHAKLLNSFFCCTGLSELKLQNDLLIKIGDNLLQNTQSAAPDKENDKENTNSEIINNKNINTNDLSLLLISTIINIEPTKTFISQGELVKLGTLLFSSSILITNLSIIINPINSIN
jgi:hypothetical protein